MFKQSFKNIDNILHTDSGSATELDYAEQTSWILFSETQFLVLKFMVRIISLRLKRG